MRSYIVMMLGLAYAGYTAGGNRKWTSPDCGRKFDEKSAERIAASLRAQGLPVSLKNAKAYK